MIEIRSGISVFERRAAIHHQTPTLVKMYDWLIES